MAFLWSLWPLNLNRWLFQLKLLHMIYISWKNYKILKFWVLDFGFGLQNFFWPFIIFLRYARNHIIWVVFHRKEFPKVIGHFKSLCFSGNKFLTIHGDPRYIPKIWVTPTAFVSRLSWKLLKKTVSKFRHQLALTVFLLVFRWNRLLAATSGF